MEFLILLILWVLSFYQILLVVRAVLDMFQIFSRDWEPQGMILVIANLVYRLTDPPLRFLGRYIPPVRLGGVALDVGFLVLFFGISILQRIITVLFLI